MASSSDPSSDPKKTSSASNTSTPTIDPENPFIAFRRFADSQISSLLQSVIGLPSLFSQPDSSNRWSSIDEVVAKRREAIVRARQDLLEELKRDMQDSFDETDPILKRREDEMQKWGALFDAANVDRHKEKREADRETARPRHERLGWDGKQRTETMTPKCDETKKDHDERFIVSTSEGTVNLNRVVDGRDEGQGFWMGKDDPRLKFNTSTGQDPFAEPDQAVAWLLTDDYSPLYLDRTLPYKIHPSFYKSDAHDSYFRGDYQPGDLYPRFASDATMRHDPRIAEMVNWRAAFHDLLDVHHYGESSSISCGRNGPYRFSAPGSAENWISALVYLGSLGSQWRRLFTEDSVSRPYRFCYGNSSEAFAVPQLIGQLYLRDVPGIFPLLPLGRYERKNDTLGLISGLCEHASSTSVPRDQRINLSSEKVDLMTLPETPKVCEESNVLKALDDEWLSYRPAFTKAAISLIRSPDTEQSTLRAVDRVLRMIENPELEDDVEDVLEEALEGMDLASPKLFKGLVNELDNLLRNDYFEEWKAAKMAVDAAHPAVYGVALGEAENEIPSSSPTSQSVSTSSSSSHCHQYDSGSDQAPSSIISTLTTVVSRTLPNGGIETKRVLKQRFGDGREEKSESTEILSGRKDPNVAEKSVPGKPEVKVVKMPDPSVVPTENKRKTGGWFWN